MPVARNPSDDPPGTVDRSSFLEALLDDLSEGIVACDADGKLSFFNRATREFHGLPEEPIPADEWAEHYHLYLPDGVTPMSKDQVPLWRAFEGEHVQDVEMVIATKEGDKRWLLASGRPIYDKEGNKQGAVVAMHDITERKKAEAYQALVDKARAQQRQALDINDNIVQGLAVAKFSLELGDTAKAATAVKATLESAQAIIGRLIEDVAAELDIELGSLMRESSSELGGDK